MSPVNVSSLALVPAFAALFLLMGAPEGVRGQATDAASARTTDLVVPPTADGDAPTDAVRVTQIATLPDTIPIFPLPDIALLPGANMPLHIFEPRYREMVADALEGDRVIGMVMLQPGWEEDYEGSPAVHSIGGAGTIEGVDELPDGRYNIVLEGTTRFRIVEEITGGPQAYRRARVEVVPESLTDAERVRLSDRRSRLEEGLRTEVPNLRIPATVSDIGFVNTVAQFLPVEPTERQALMEAENALARADLILELLGLTQQARNPAPRLGDPVSH